MKPKTILIIILFVTIYVNGQTIEEIQNQIRTMIQLQTGYDYYVYAKKAVAEEFEDGTFSDPNNLLEDSYLFVTRSAPVDDGTSQNSFLGIFKNNSIIWQSPKIINADNSWGQSIGDVRDLNNDQSIEIVSEWAQGMSGYTEDVWIISWDGTNGEIVNDYKNNGRSDINIVTGSLKIVDIEVDGVLEIDGITLEGEDEIEKIYSWSNGIIGDFGVPVPQVLPRDRALDNVKSAVTKQDSLYFFNYTIIDSTNSPQSIELFGIDCSIANQTATQVPVRWDFSNIYDRNLICWNYNIIISSNYNNYLIHPGEIENNFALVSTNLPGIAKYYLQGNNDDVSINIDEIFYNTSIGYTLIPTILDSIGVIDFLDTLINYNQRSYELGWIANQLTADKYDSLFTRAKTFLEENYITWVDSTLHTVLQEVDSDSSGNITSEAYALLRYNSEYLLANLPDVTAPIINSISPPLALPYFATPIEPNVLPITITGQFFTDSTVAYYNGYAKPTTFISDSVITINLNSIDFRSAGDYPIWVSNYGSVSDTMYLSVVNSLPERIMPTLQCIIYNPDKTFTAHFGYNNQNSVPVGIVSRSNYNYFTPGDRYRGQPNIFLPGNHSDVFSTVFDGANLYWVLSGGRIVANKYSAPCD